MEDGSVISADVGRSKESRRETSWWAGWRDSLSFRLFVLTIGTILFVEVVIFVPSAANHRDMWLQERVKAARIASLVIEAAPDRDVSRELSSALLSNAEVLAVAEMADGVRYQLLAPQIDISRPVVKVDLLDKPSFLEMILETNQNLFARDGRTLMVVAEGAEPDRVLEILIPEAPLKQDLWDYAFNILILSLIISVITGAIIFTLLLRTVVRPIRRVTASVEQFRKDPGAWTRRLPPTTRRDEIGRAQNALSDMEAAVSNSFRQRERLAQLGEAVARINHDLRGSLAAAQLVSDSLARSEDPRVKRAAPRLERALERAIALASDTLQFGKAKQTTVYVQKLLVKPVLDEAAEEALARHPDILWENDIDAGAVVCADAESLHRIATNLIRNAAEAMGKSGKVCARMDGQTLYLLDSGPGLPEELQSALFKPFGVTTKRKGTGLGLAIARDLARAMGGDLSLEQTGATGTEFAITLPVVD